MTTLEESRQRLAQRYRRGLGARIEALQTLVTALREGDPEAEASIRRIAHQLKGSGSSFGLDQVTVAARAVEQAPDGGLAAEVDALLEVLKNSHAGSTAIARVLLIEDHEELARFLVTALESGGRKVERAGSLAQGRALLEADLSAIILDLTLPDGDGRDLLVEIVNDPILGAIPVVVLTARETERTHAECLALGAAQCLVKPVKLELLLTALEAVVAQTRRTRADAMVDTLTGLANRAGFAEAYARAEAQARRSGRPLSLALLDLDHFKSINDTLGHAGGDRVLVQVSALLLSRLRRSDVSARWGGEEFVVLFPDTDEHGALQALDNLRTVLRRGSSAQGMPPVTLSGGVVRVAGGDSLQSSVARADALLYQAKANGRDLVLDSPAPRGRTRVLVVEDDPDVGDAVQLMMRKVGFEVEVARSLAEARAAVRHSRHEVVVLDQELPDGDGLDFIDELRRMAGGSDRAIVMLTANGSDANVEAAFDRGASDFVHKPFKPRRLLARIQRLLPR